VVRISRRIATNVNEGIGIDVVDAVVRSAVNDRDRSVPNNANLEGDLTVYLAHKYEQQALGLEVMAELEAAGITVLNPFIRKEQEKYDDVIATKGGQFDDQISAEIVNADLRLIDKSDAVVALLCPNAIGTVMEIFYAGHVKRIPVFTWVTYSMPYRHPWIAHYSEMFLDKEPFLAVVKGWGKSGR